MDSFKRTLAILLGCQPDEASILASVQQLTTLEADLKASQDALESLTEAVYRAQILGEKPSEVQEALENARRVLGV